MTEENLFGQVREQALELWKATTFRDCEAVNDDITNSYECMWQDRATSLNYKHISIFCSLGEWANNITDVLKDESCDDYSFLDPEHCQALFRYYTRMFLVTSEMLSDFEEITAFVNSTDVKSARTFLSDKPFGLDTLFGFTNTVCKHKAKHIHLCNHHLPIWFEDCSEVCPFVQPITIGHLDFDQPDGIFMPTLADVIMTVVICYNRLNELFERETNKFKAICDRYAAT